MELNKREIQQLREIIAREEERDRDLIKLEDSVSSLEEKYQALRDAFVDQENKIIDIT